MDGFAEVNGTRLYFEVTGSGPPLVLVSGGATLDCRGWDGQIEAFASHFRVIRYDIRGIGRSARPTADFSHSRDLRELMAFLKIDAACVCGLSFGAAIALDLVLGHPASVDALVLASPGVSSERDLESLTALSTMTREQGLDAVLDLITGMPSVIAPDNVAGRNTLRRIYLDNRDVFESGFPLIKHWQPPPEAGDRLGEVTAPTLIVGGDQDSAASNATAERLAAGIAGARRVVIPGAAHVVNFDRPMEFNRALLEFLAPARVSD